MPDITPQRIVAELNKHIVGQEEAKRAVAVALRNRWRRAQIPEPMRSEITPKNILMIGPTGVGKTEIARRLARLAAGAAPVRAHRRQRLGGDTPLRLRRGRRGTRGERREQRTRRARRASPA